MSNIPGINFEHPVGEPIWIGGKFRWYIEGKRYYTLRKYCEDAGVSDEDYVFLNLKYGEIEKDSIGDLIRGQMANATTDRITRLLHGNWDDDSEA